MYANLREFVGALERAGELSRVKAPVDPVLEIAWIADRQSRLPAPGSASEAARRTDPRFHHLGGRAVLFERVEGSDLPVLINGWGSYRRMEMALGCDDAGHTPGGFEAIARRIAGLLKPEPPAGWRDAIRKARAYLPLLRMAPRRLRGSGPCQQVVLTGDAVDLTALPIIRCWPFDGDPAAMGYPPGVNDGIPGVSGGREWDARFRGRYITLAGIHTIHAQDQDHPRPPSHNIGMYRVQLFGPRTMSMHWHMHHDGARHWRSWKALGKPMPVAVVLGGESVLPYAATAPLPPGISELLMAGFLNRGGIPLVRAKTVPLWVPANAEIVIEGYVRHDAGLIGWEPGGRVKGGAGGEPLGPGAVFEGPFGDHTGYYSMPDRYPILEVTAITRRKDAIYPTTVVGLPPQEDYFLGKATERIFLPPLRTLVHDIEDYDLPMFGAFHNCAAVKIKKAYPLQGRRVMHSVWGAGQMAWTKTIFVVDDDVDVHDTRAVLRAAARHCHPRRDIETVNGPLDILDHAAPRLGAGMKIGFDCTRKVAGEEVGGIRVPPPGEVDPAQSGDGGGLVSVIMGDVRALPGVVGAAMHEGWLFVKIEKRSAGEGPGVAARLQALAGRWDRSSPPFVVLVAGNVEVNDLDSAFFHWCANTDVSRDSGGWITPGGRYVATFDATPKAPGDERHGQPVRRWPPILRPDPSVAAKVQSRWREYGF